MDLRSDGYCGRRFRRTIVAVAITSTATLAVGPAAVASPVQPTDVKAKPVGACFAGRTQDATCAVATDYATDWVLAGAAQDAQIMATGRVKTTGLCNGAYYLTNTIVATLPIDQFDMTFRPWDDGVTLTKSPESVPAGLFAYTITGRYDAYEYAARLYQRQINQGDSHAAGRVAPMYVAVLNPAPKVGPGTMPLGAGTTPHWTPPNGVVLSARKQLVVFDTSDSPIKQDLAPADGWQDATAGHGRFVRGVAEAAVRSAVTLVDITADDGLVTEGTIATTIEATKFTAGGVANLSAGTYYCGVETKRGIVPLTSVVLPQLVEWVASKWVHLVAAAGNDGSTREFFPAAYGVRPVPLYGNPCKIGVVDPVTGVCLVDDAKSVTSVGSLLAAPTKDLVRYTSPSAGERSSFSNYGDWVESWADGSDIVSDYPDAAFYYCVPTSSPGTCLSHGNKTITDVGAASAHLNKLVVWSGTSFSTPQVASWIAAGNSAP